MHQIEIETLTLKYDTIDLELRGGEFRNGISVKNWARDHVGGSPTRSALLILHTGQWKCCVGLCSKRGERKAASNSWNFPQSIDLNEPNEPTNSITDNLTSKMTALLTHH